MKKIISLLMAVALLCTAVASLASCGEQATTNTTATTEATTEATTVPVFNPLDPSVAIDEGYGLEGKTPTDVSYFKYKELDDGTVKITGTYIDRANTLKELVIPAVINGKKVSVLGETALGALSDVETIILPDYIVTIEAFAFRGCNSVTTIKLPKYVTSLGDGVFRECTSLTAVNFIPDSVSTIGARAFESCTALAEVVLPNSVTTIGEYAFVGCTALKNVVLSNSLKTIPDKMFMDCNKIGKDLDEYVLVIPDSVTEIGKMAFYGCNNITQIIISKNVTKIGDKAFYECKRIAEIVIPEGCTYIGEEAFSSCMTLKTLAIPDSVKTIGNYALKGCSKLETVTLPGGTDTIIGTEIFLAAKKIKTINVKAGSVAQTYANDWVTAITTDKATYDRYETNVTINVQ